jgi:multidrug efflux pump subunit AcrB
MCPDGHARMGCWRVMVLVKNLKFSRGRATLALCVCCGLGTATFAPAASCAALPHGSARQLQMRLAQSDSSSGDQAEITPEQVEKYIAVYKATQSNHSLTVEQAAAQQGLTVAQFRALEGRIERDDALRERVRRALRNNPGEAKP